MIRDVHEFLDSKISSNLEINECSPQTRLSLASHYLSAIGKQECLTESDFSGCLFPLQNKSEMLDDLHFNMQTVGMILQTLWSGIQDIEAIEDSVRLQIETLANKKKGIEKEKKKPRKRLRLREISEVPRIIRNESDLKNALDGIENAVKEISGTDQEAELD